ncbi:MAG: DNA polymerase III subunit delta' [Gammaproteobacteria bacterium]|nr:DNA polymerase III subunit delta' [Gammaproteobacteria bacterium]
MAEGPMSLLEIHAQCPWHEGPWDFVRNALASGRMPHALMLHGRPGLGKGLFARRLAELLLCTAPTESGSPCGVCRSCQLFAADSHPDMNVLTLLEDKNEISVDQVRELSGSLTLANQSQGYRVVIIEPAERLSLAAANSLLKAIEEPVGPTVFVLVLNDVARLPATIASRCQRIAFHTPDPELAETWLSEWISDPERRASLLDLANGAPFEALALHQDDLAGPSRREMLAQIADLVRGDSDPLSVADAWLKSDPKTSLYSMYTCVADLIVLASAHDYVAALPESSHAKRLARRLDSYPERDTALLRQWSVPALYGQLDRITRAIRLLTSQASQQLLLEELAVCWACGDEQTTALA